MAIDDKFRDEKLQTDISIIERAIFTYFSLGQIFVKKLKQSKIRGRSSRPKIN